MKYRLLLGSLATAALLPTATAAALFGVTADNKLVSFDTATPASFLTSVTITGLFEPQLQPND